MVSSQFTPSQEELSLADRILSKLHEVRVKHGDDAGARLDADSAVTLFLTTGLSPQILSKIWSEADTEEKGWLSRQELTVALRLIGWAQSGERISDKNLLAKVGPLALIAGFDPQVPSKDSCSTPALPHESSSTSSSSLLNPAVTGDRIQLKKGTPVADSYNSSPPITPFISIRALISRADLQEWNVPDLFTSHCHRLFEQTDLPQKGYLDAETEALSLFRKAKLTDDQLSRMWHVLGVEHSGRLSRENFVGGLYLVYRVLAGLEIPENLPNSFAAMYSTQSLFTDPFNHEASSSSLGPGEDDEVGSLYVQIRSLQDALTTVGQENEDLRSSVQTLTRLSRQQTVSQNRMSRSVDSSLAEIARLQSELQDKDNASARLNASLRITEELSRENTVFRLQIEELTSHLEASHGEAATQRLISEELGKEADRLKQQLDDVREASTHVPSVTGDQELQNQINEDLSRENRRLRNQARELQESLTNESGSLNETNRTLTRENRHLQRRVRELESAAIAQDGMRRQIVQLNRDNESLRRDLEQARRRLARRTTADIPPPAYEDIGRYR